MPVLKKYIAPSFIIIFSLFVMNFCRIVPVSRFFKGYDIVFVTDKLPEKTVIKVLEENGCRNIISRENQKIPLLLNENSPEVALAKSNLEKSTYLADRLGFFYDKSMKNNIFYVPVEELKSAENAVQEISGKGYLAGINAAASLPVFSIAVVVAFAVLLVFFSENRILCGLSFVLPVVFSFMMPFCSISAGLCLFELFMFFYIKFWGRKNSARKLLRNVMLMTILGTSFLCMVFTKIQAGLFFLLMIFSELSIFLLYKNVRDKIDTRYSFRPVRIRTAFSIRILNKRNRKLLPLCALSVLLILLSSAVSSNFSSVFRAEKTSGLQLPSSAAAVSSLPGMGDFVEWKWEALTFPYRSINVKSKKNTGDEVIFKNFQKKDGFIQETVNSICYNDEFKTNAIEEIGKLDYPALEKMLADQGKGARFGYVSSGLQNISLVMIIILIIAFFVPLSFYLTTKRWELK